MPVSEQILIAIIGGVCGGGAVSSVVTAFLQRRKTRAEESQIIASAAKQALDTVTEDVINPLREQLDYQERQIEHLESQQRKYFLAVAYTRKLFHWLQSFCEVVEPSFLESHPKPSLPDELRPDIAPETVKGAVE